MHQDRITKSSNMLHSSNASSIEKNRRYLVIKGIFYILYTVTLLMILFGDGG